MSNKLKSDTIGIKEFKTTVITPENFYNITFHKDNKNIGRLHWDDGVMKFDGEVEESAQLFFDYLLNQLINPYVKAKLAKTETRINEGQNATSAPSRLK